MGVTGDERRIAERRTLALRGPGAGGFTPPQSLAASNPCLNCGTNIQLTYCPECGQREIDSDPTLREFLHELAEEFLHWDGKLFKTVRLLFTRPGQLTVEYLDGKRVRYISPLRIYLVCSVMFFFFAALIPTRSVNSAARATPSSATQAKDTAASAALVGMASSRNFAVRKLGENIPKVQRNRRDVSQTMFAAIPKTMFVLLPAFAGLLALAFRDRRRRYPQHLAFALHVHAVLFTGLTVLLLRRVIPVDALRTVLSLIVGGSLGAYFLLAARRVYGGAHQGVLARVTFVFGAYAVAFLTMMGVAFLVIVLTM